MSEPTPIDLPVGLRWVKLVCRLGRLVTDSAADADAHPDLLPVGGTLTLHASPSRVRIQEDDGRWRSVEVAGRTYTIRADGELVDNEGRVGVYIPDPASLLVEPQGYAITAAVKPTGGTDWRVTVGGGTVLPDVVDLVAVSSVGSASPSVTASFDARLYALETGGGVDVGQAVEDYLVANPPAGTGGSGVTADDTPAVPTEGQSASYLVTSAVTWPGGLVWSDDPDGGVAPTITGAALVSLFTVGGVTRAVMGATFPGAAPPPDTTAPVAGTLAVVPSSTSALGTVTGASDAVALAAAPYSFRLDAGAWSAWQAADTYTWTGLTAETAYTFHHRVRDAAGNITEGTAVTDTTSAPPSELTAAFLSSHVYPEKLASYTFEDVPLGDAAADRTIVVAVHSRNPGLTVTAVSVGGVAATIDAQITETSGQIAGLAHALVPAGATGDITVDFGGGVEPLRAAIGVWRITGDTAVAALDTATNTTKDGALTVTGAAGTVLLAASTSYGSDATWSVATEDYDEPAQILGVSGARAALATPGDVSLACTWATINGNPAAVAVVYGAA